MKLTKIFLITLNKFLLNKIIGENFAAKLKQPNLAIKTDFDNKIINFNWKITSNRKKYLESTKELNSLITKDHNFFLGRINFTSNDGC